MADHRPLSRRAVAPDTTNPSTFAELGVSRDVCAALEQQGVTSPFPIQSLTLPDSLRGRDVLGRGQTGSGKTLAFVLPLVTRLAADGKTPMLAVVDGRFAGVIGVADTLKDGSAAAVAALRARGIDVVMMTGDNAATAAAIRSGSRLLATRFEPYSTSFPLSRGNG